MLRCKYYEVLCLWFFTHAPLPYKLCCNLKITWIYQTNICECVLRQLGWYSDSLPVVQSRDKIMVGATFSTPVQTGPGAHPASHTMGTGSFLGLKQPGRGIDHPPPSSIEVKARIELYISSPSGPSWPVLGWTSPFFYI